ncbi:MAG TPA: NYN domain-containing protein [Gaiellaceae bacterium]|nr:NYN domain-containing protein [Gaiellaceae bacterium]
MPDSQRLYLFDGFNLLYASPYEDVRELVDALASFVAMKGARGVVVFDGVGPDAVRGPLEVRYAPDADTLLEKLAAEHRATEPVFLVTSDTTVANAAGLEVAKISSRTFFRDLEPPVTRPAAPQGLASKLDEKTRALLDRMRRGD